MKFRAVFDSVVKVDTDVMLMFYAM